jgi:hypothetical protein
MGKEKAIGALIFIGALLVLLYYTWGLIILELLPSLRVDVNNVFGEGSLLASLFNPPAVIAMWIGWTMLTTPAPEPLEDFDFDEEKVAESKPEE